MVKFHIDVSLLEVRKYVWSICFCEAMVYGSARPREKESVPEPFRELRPPNVKKPHERYQNLGSRTKGCWNVGQV